MSRGTRRVADRRGDLLGAAEAIIAERGFEGLRVRAVADRAGVNVATLHYYFPTKEDLVRGVAAAIVADLAGPPDLHGHALSGAPADILHGHLDHVLAQMREAPQRFVALNEVFVRAARDEGLRDVLFEAQERWHAFLQPVLRAGVAGGSFRADLDAYAAARAIAALLMGLRLRVNAPIDDAERSVAELERMLGQAGGGAD